MIDDKLIGKMHLKNSDTAEGREQILIDGRAENDAVKVVVDANMKLRQILISQELFDKNNKQLVEEFVQKAVNNAFENMNQLLIDNK